MLSIGLELQTPQLTICFIHPDGRIGYPEDDYRISLGVNKMVYNDTVSDRKMRKKLTEFVDNAAAKKWSQLTCTTESGKNYTITDLEGLINDAEFIFLYPDNKSTGDIIDLIMGHVLTSLRFIAHFLQESDDFTRIQAVRSSSSRPVRIHDFPFRAAIGSTEDTIMFLQKSRDVSFYIQTTIKCKIEQTLPILRHLISASKETMTEDVDLILHFNPDNTTRRLRTITALFLHYFLTHTAPKKAVFIVRHLFKDILKSLTPTEYNKMCRLVHTQMKKMPRLEGADIFMQKLIDTDKKYEHEVSMITVTNFAFDGIHIMFEFRLIHPILAERMGLKHDHLIPLQS